MANIRSARKRIRSSARKHEQNRGVRSSVRTAVVKARRMVLAGEEGTVALVRDATSALDKAAQHGVLHPRNAARRKSRLMRLAARQTDHAAVETVAAPRSRASASTRGTMSKAAAVSRRAAATSKTGKKTTKTERTAASIRRAASEPKS